MTDNNIITATSMNSTIAQRRLFSVRLKSYFRLLQIFLLLVLTACAYLKQCMGGWFNKLVPPRPSHNRHRLGIILLTMPLSVGILWPYVVTVIDTLVNYEMRIAIAGDLTIVVALMVLGGDFWNKLTGLFNYQCRIEKYPTPLNSGVCNT